MWLEHFLILLFIDAFNSEPRDNLNVEVNHLKGLVNRNLLENLTNVVNKRIKRDYEPYNFGYYERESKYNSDISTRNSSSNTDNTNDYNRHNYNGETEAHHQHFGTRTLQSNKDIGKAVTDSNKDFNAHTNSGNALQENSNEPKSLQINEATINNNKFTGYNNVGDTNGYKKDFAKANPLVNIPADYTYNSIYKSFINNINKNEYNISVINGYYNRHAVKRPEKSTPEGHTTKSNVDSSLNYHSIRDQNNGQNSVNTSPNYNTIGDEYRREHYVNTSPNYQTIRDKNNDKYTVNTSPNYKTVTDITSIKNAVITTPNYTSMGNKNIGNIANSNTPYNISNILNYSGINTFAMTLSNFTTWQKNSDNIENNLNNTGISYRSNEKGSVNERSHRRKKNNTKPVILEGSIIGSIGCASFFRKIGDFCAPVEESSEYYDYE